MNQSHVSCTRTPVGGAYSKETSKQQECAVWGCVTDGEMGGNAASLSLSHKVDEDERTDSTHDPKVERKHVWIRILSVHFFHVNEKRGHKGPVNACLSTRQR